MIGTTQTHQKSFCVLFSLGRGIIMIVFTLTFGFGLALETVSIWPIYSFGKRGDYSGFVFTTPNVMYDDLASSDFGGYFTSGSDNEMVVWFKTQETCEQGSLCLFNLGRRREAPVRCMKEGGHDAGRCTFGAVFMTKL